MPALSSRGLGGHQAGVGQPSLEGPIFRSTLRLDSDLFRAVLALLASERAL